jgi:3-oxo-5alpha-steroid 4-dehydrogenase
MGDFSLHRPLAAIDVPRWDLETDVAIIGFGATGACAAIEAANAGAQVMLFERNSGSGGASGLSGLGGPTSRGLRGFRTQPKISPPI